MHSVQYLEPRKYISLHPFHQYIKSHGPSARQPHREMHIVNIHNRIDEQEATAKYSTHIQKTSSSHTVIHPCQIHNQTESKIT